MPPTYIKSIVGFLRLKIMIKERVNSNAKIYPRRQRNYLFVSRQVTKWDLWVLFTSSIKTTTPSPILDITNNDNKGPES